MTIGELKRYLAEFHEGYDDEPVYLQVNNGDTMPVTGRHWCATVSSVKGTRPSGFVLRFKQDQTDPEAMA